LLSFYKFEDVNTFNNIIIKCLLLLIIVCCNCLLLPNKTLAQPITFEKYYDYGYAEDGYCVQQTSDGGYIIAGRQGITFGVSKILLIKTDSFGQVIWYKLIGGSNFEHAYFVQQTSDGGYILTGEATGSAPNDYDVYLVKTDSNGDTVWTKKYGSTVYEHGWSVQQTTDGGYIIAGERENAAYLIKTDLNGDSLWTKTFIPIGSGSAAAYSVQQTNDNGFILTGTADFIGSGNDVYLIKTDSLGDTLWTKIYGGVNWDRGQSVQQTNDNGYIIAGYTASFGAGSYDVYLIKTNSNGDTLWTKTFGGIQDDAGKSVQSTSDAGYIIGGYTYSFGAGNYDVYLIKTNSNGDTLWTKTFGGIESDNGYFVRQTSDGGYITTGVNSSYCLTCVYLIKTDSTGYAPTGINNILTSALKGSRVYPNPATSFLNIELFGMEQRIWNIEVVIYDHLGRETKRMEEIPINVHSDNILRIRVERDYLAGGMYFFQISSMSRVLATGKMIVQD